MHIVKLAGTLKYKKEACFDKGIFYLENFIQSYIKEKCLHNSNLLIANHFLPSLTSSKCVTLYLDCQIPRELPYI